MHEKFRPSDHRLFKQSAEKRLTAINQYFLHSKMQADWGFEHLAKHSMEESIDEMKHAEKITERILFLEGLPNLQELGKLMIGEDVKEMLECDLRLEMIAFPRLARRHQALRASGDFATHQLLQEILSSEEEHVDWIETQLGLIDKTGLQNYLQSQIA
ncbi:MAG: bacterioferritin [Pseudomonadota bacterium]|nr:MAG: bacterioferritin [Pseudomonadota bacterium]